MLRAWYLVCFFIGRGLADSGVPQGSYREEGDSVSEDGATAGVLLLRMKRSPARTMTISGYLPNGGLSYASTDLMYPYNSMGYSGGMDMWPYSSQAQPKVPSKELEPPSRSDTYGPDDSAPPVVENEPSWPEKGSGPSANNRMTSWSAPRKNKKKQWFQKLSPPTTADEDAEEGSFDKNDGAAKAQASFNAWFPIMLGVFPPYGQGGGAPEEAQRGGYPPSSSSHGSPSHGSPSHGSPSHGSPSYGPPSHGPGSHGSQGGSPSHSQSPLQRYYTTTVIANSVNNGRSGIASSTATAYGGEQPQPQQRYSA